MKKTMTLAGNGKALPFLVEDSAYEGVKRIAAKGIGVIYISHRAIRVFGSSADPAIESLTA